MSVEAVAGAAVRQPRERFSFTGSRNKHPIVSLDYVVRVPATFIVMLMVGTVLYDQRSSLFAWTMVIFYGVLGLTSVSSWPATAGTQKRRSCGTLVDSFIQGCLVSLVGFSSGRPWSV